MNKLIGSLLLALVLVFPAWSQDLAGKAATVIGVAYATDAQGAQRRLSKDDSVFAGETISTLRHSYVNIVYRDEGRTLLGPNSQMKIEEFHYPAPVSGGPRAKGEPGAVAASSEPARSIFSLLKGGLRAISGLIGKQDHNAYSLKTSVATIGIRGTDYFVVRCEDQCEGLGQLPPGIIPKDGVIVGVHEGGVALLNNENRSFDVNQDQFVLVTANGEFISLPGMPAFMLLMPLQDPKDCE